VGLAFLKIAVRAAAAPRAVRVAATSFSDRSRLINIKCRILQALRPSPAAVLAGTCRELTLFVSVVLTAVVPMPEEQRVRV